MDVVFTFVEKLFDYYIRYCFTTVLFHVQLSINTNGYSEKGNDTRNGNDYTVPAITDPSEELTARISEEEAAAIRRWENSATGKQSIWIVRKVPFAIMILIGFVGWIGFRLLGR